MGLMEMTVAWLFKPKKKTIQLNIEMTLRNLHFDGVGVLGNAIDGRAVRWSTVNLFLSLSGFEALSSDVVVAARDRASLPPVGKPEIKKSCSVIR